MMVLYFTDGSEVASIKTMPDIYFHKPSSSHNPVNYNAFIKKTYTMKFLVDIF